MKSEIQVRLALLNILDEVLVQHRSLTSVLPDYLKDIADPRDQALIQFCAYGIFRDFFRLEFIIKKLAPRKMTDSRIYYLLLIGIYQLSASRIPDFAVVNTLVNTAKHLKLFFATGFINGVLREYLRKKIELQDELEKNEMTHYSHPQWLINCLKSAWPEQWQKICSANNQPAPMWLRINQQKIMPDAYIALLQESNIAVHSQQNTACCLQEAQEVTDLPGFTQGWVSVQDGAAQYAAELLDVQPHHLVLDACAAPGGKTGHILEQQPLVAKVIALDKDPQRALKIQQNLQRLQLNAEVIVGDAAHPAAWWNQQLFDRILLDAPCSATGVIRRHPDIKLLRRKEDIAELADQQLLLLTALWPLLKPNGKLLYATCSILPQENEDIIAKFCQQQADARTLKIHLSHGITTPHGWQLLPGSDAMDGFFYALLSK